MVEDTHLFGVDSSFLSIFRKMCIFEKDYLYILKVVVITLGRVSFDT